LSRLPKTKGRIYTAQVPTKRRAKTTVAGCLNEMSPTKTVKGQGVDTGGVPGNRRASDFSMGQGGSAIP